MLPNQVMREVDNFIFTNLNPIYFAPPFVETVEDDDDIIRERLPIDNDNIIDMFKNYIIKPIDHGGTPNVVDAYANESYVNKNEADNAFFGDSFVATQKDLNNIFMIPTPKRTHRTRLTPVVLLKIKAINGVPVAGPLTVLYDSRSTRTLIKYTSLPFAAKPIITDHVTVSTTTTQGKHECNKTTFMEHIQVTKFVNGRSIEGLQANMFHSTSCPYNVILRTDYLQAIGMKLDYQHDVIQWLDVIVDMKNVCNYRNFLEVQDMGLQPQDNKFLNELYELNQIYYDTIEDNFLCNNAWDNFAAEILERKYDRVTARDAVAQQDHILPKQKQLFKNTLEKHEILFDGKLGHYPHEKFHIDFVEGSKPMFKKAYHVLFQRESLFKDEIQNVVKDGILEPCGQLHLAAPTFVVPKKDNRVQWVSNFCELNNLIKRKLFPMLKIQDIIN